MNRVLNEKICKNCRSCPRLGSEID